MRHAMRGGRPDTDRYPAGVLTGPTAPGAAPALLAHGAGSTAEFVLRTFSPALADLGLRVVTWQQRHAPAPHLAPGAHPAAPGLPQAPDPEPDPQAAPDAEPGATLARLARRLSPALVGGVSLGAHAAAAWAARTGYRGRLLLVMPAWTGGGSPPPAAAAAAAGAAAEEVAALGVAGALERVRAQAHPWVAAELARAWPRYGTAELVAALRAAAAGGAPGPATLARIEAATAVVALTDDPLHPLAEAERWAALIPGARLVTVGLGAAGPDLGAAAARALGAAGPGPADRPAVSGSRRSPDPAPGG